MDIKERKTPSRTTQIYLTAAFSILFLGCLYCRIFVFPWGKSPIIGAFSVALALGVVFTWVKIDSKNKVRYYFPLVFGIALIFLDMLGTEKLRAIYAEQQLDKYGVINTGQIVNVYTKFGLKTSDRKLATLAFRIKGEVSYAELSNEKKRFEKDDLVKFIYSSKNPHIISVLKVERPSPAQLNTDNNTTGNSNLRGVPKPVAFIDHPPQFPGDMPALYAYLRNNVSYPKEAKDQGISGKVFISFVITEDGSVADVKVEKGIGGGCDEAAIETVSNMPKWKPGVQNGKPVRVKYNIPISFSL